MNNRLQSPGLINYSILDMRIGSGPKRLVASIIVFAGAAAARNAA